MYLSQPLPSQPAATSPDDFLSPLNLTRIDQTVAEVYRRMLGLALTVQADTEPQPAGLPAQAADAERTAIIAFSGAMRGWCELRMQTSAATEVAAILLGSTAQEIAAGDEDSLDDALGELCNMIAGGWKERVPHLSAACTLSPPTMVSGRHYKVHSSRGALKLSRRYGFAGHQLVVCIRREVAA